MDPLGTNMYLLKRYRPSDSFCTFISESVEKNITKTHAIDIHTLTDGILEVCDQHLSPLVT